MSVKRNPGLHWFCFTVLCEWSRKLAPPSKPIRYKTKTNRDLVTRVFPRLRLVTCVYFDFSLAPSDILVCSNWPLWLLWFWFYDTQSKSALMRMSPMILITKQRRIGSWNRILFCYIQYTCDCKQKKWSYEYMKIIPVYNCGGNVYKQWVRSVNS